MTNQSKTKQRKTVGHNLTQEEKERLQNIAREQSRSLSAQITYMLRKQLAEIEERT